jgi:alpha-beta hydrolase superfamily lysophospholipase
MTIDTSTFVATDGVEIAVHRWLPDAAPKAIVQISHGMAEYARRYERFAEALVERGYAVYGADHRGHGQTAGTLAKLGWLADHHGFERVMEDQAEISGMIAERHPGVGIILFSHSFGSFLAQMYMERHGELIQGCVLSGTRGPDPALVFGGHAMTYLIAACIGKKKRSPFLTKLSFGACNARIPHAESPNAWLSRDAEEVEKYDASPWTGFTCTAGFYRDMLDGLSAIHASKALRSIPKKLPVLIVSGTEDPIGKYGKTVRKLHDLYLGHGMENVRLLFNEGGRHESLNETNRDEITASIIDWMDKVISGESTTPLTEQAKL